MRKPIVHRLLLSLSFTFSVILLVTGCSNAQPTSQGPTGDSAKVSSLESYLIPPEIPPTLLDFIFATTPAQMEILSLEVIEMREKRWTIEVSTEAPPDQSEVAVRRFARIGDTWRSL